MATGQNNNRPTAAAATTLTAAQLTARAASQRGAMDAMNNASSSPWISGIKFGTYTDVYDSASGELKTFYTSGSYEGRGADRVLKPEGERKIAGRVVMDEQGKEVKLYNGFIALLSGINGVKAVTVEDATNGNFTFTAIEGAKFGVWATQTDEDSRQVDDQNKPYKVIKHTLCKAQNEPKPTKEQVAAL